MIQTMQVSNPFGAYQKIHSYVMWYILALVAAAVLLTAVAMPIYFLKIQHAEQQVEALQHRNKLLQHRKALQNAEQVLFGGGALIEDVN